MQSRHALVSLLVVLVCATTASCADVSDPSAPGSAQPAWESETLDGGSASATLGVGSQSESLSSSGATTYLIHAAGYDTAGRRGTYLSIGTYTLRADGTGTLDYFQFDADRNRTGGATTALHPAMGAPYGGGCTPGPIWIPSYEAYLSFPVTWTSTTSQIRVVVGSVAHVWSLAVAGGSRYSLVGYTGVAITNAVGVAYLTTNNPRTSTPLARAQLRSGYGGRSWQRSSPTGGWTLASSGLTTRLFAPTAASDVHRYAAQCEPTGMWCQSTLLLNYAPWSRNLIYVNGGHDFDMDGCYDETGHRLMVLADRGAEGVTRAVVLEYSAEDDGWPLLGIGYYE